MLAAGHWTNVPDCVREAITDLQAANRALQSRLDAVERNEHTAAGDPQLARHEAALRKVESDVARVGSLAAARAGATAALESKLDRKPDLDGPELTALRARVAELERVSDGLRADASKAPSAAGFTAMRAAIEASQAELLARAPWRAAVAEALTHELHRQLSPILDSMPALVSRAGRVDTELAAVRAELAAVRAAVADALPADALAATLCPLDARVAALETALGSFERATVSNFIASTRAALAALGERVANKADATALRAAIDAAAPADETARRLNVLDATLACKADARELEGELAGCVSALDFAQALEGCADVADVRALIDEVAHVTRAMARSDEAAREVSASVRELERQLLLVTTHLGAAVDARAPLGEVTQLRAESSQQTALLSGAIDAVQRLLETALAELRADFAQVRVGMATRDEIARVGDTAAAQARVATEAAQRALRVAESVAAAAATASASAGGPRAQPALIATPAASMSAVRVAGPSTPAATARLARSSTAFAASPVPRTATERARANDLGRGRELEHAAREHEHERERERVRDHASAAASVGMADILAGVARSPVRTASRLASARSPVPRGASMSGVVSSLTFGADERSRSPARAPQRAAAVRTPARSPHAGDAASPVPAADVYVSSLAETMAEFTKLRQRVGRRRNELVLGGTVAVVPADGTD